MSEFKHTPEEARKLWIEALRSGEYEQGIGALKIGDKLCCLGVACVVFSEREHELTVSEGTAGDTAFDQESHVLPATVTQWLGLDTAEGEFLNDEGGLSYLHEINDSGTPFKRIADIIEESPPGLFVEASA